MSINRRLRLFLSHLGGLRVVSLLLLGAAVATHFAPALADVPETYRKTWSDASTRIDQDIERYRKGECTLKIVGADGQPLTEAAVEVQQKTHQFLFGCNLFVLGQLDTPELNRKYEEAFARLFNFATLPFYWRDLEPEEGKPRFTEGSPYIWRRPPPDPLVRWCKARGIVPKGHALMYAKNKFMPDWTARDNGESLRTQAHKHMSEIAERYGHEIAVWDVVNEELPRLAHPAEWHVVPDDYLAWCFETAGRLFPKDVKLLINDGINQAHITTSEYEEKIKALLDRGLRVEGIGIQFHTSRAAMFKAEPYSPDHLAGVYQRLGRLGLPLYITEITIPGIGEEGPAEQAAIVADLYRLWFSTPDMAGVTWWNLADGTAYENENKALGGLLDKDMNPKAAYQALDRLINHDWKTKLTARTDTAGTARFRGFFGEYVVRVVVGDRRQEFTINLLRNGQNQHRLIVAKP